MKGNDSGCSIDPISRRLQVLLTVGLLSPWVIATSGPSFATPTPTSDGAWQPVLPTPTSRALSSIDPQIAVNDAGDVVLGWIEGGETPDFPGEGRINYSASEYNVASGWSPAGLVEHSEFDLLLRWQGHDPGSLTGRLGLV